MWYHNYDQAAEFHAAPFAGCPVVIRLPEERATFGKSDNKSRSTVLSFLKWSFVLLATD